jgi:hypothetical protein
VQFSFCLQVGTSEDDREDCWLRLNGVSRDKEIELRAVGPSRVGEYLCSGVGRMLSLHTPGVVSPVMHRRELWFRYRTIVCCV